MHSAAAGRSSAVRRHFSISRLFRSAGSSCALRRALRLFSGCLLRRTVRFFRRCGCHRILAAFLRALPMVRKIQIVLIIRSAGIGRCIHSVIGCRDVYFAALNIDRIAFKPFVGLCHINFASGDYERRRRMNSVISGRKLQGAAFDIDTVSSLLVWIASSSAVIFSSPSLIRIESFAAIPLPAEVILYAPSVITRSSLQTMPCL